jgi:hypothetical protein
VRGLAVRQEHAPDADHLEELEAIVVRELAKLMEHGREQLRKLQDVEAEIAGGKNGGAQACRHKCLYDLRVIARQLQRAQAMLVPTDDPRGAVVPRVLGWLEEAEKEDKPWKTVAA